MYGDNRPYTVALVVVNQQELLERMTTTTTTTADEVHSLVKDELLLLGQSLKSYERPADFRIVPEAFSQENQMLTPKMFVVVIVIVIIYCRYFDRSLRRNGILRVYQKEIDAMYPSKR